MTQFTLRRGILPAICFLLLALFSSSPGYAQYAVSISRITGLDSLGAPTGIRSAPSQKRTRVLRITLDFHASLEGELSAGENDIFIKIVNGRGRTFIAQDNEASGTFFMYKDKKRSSSISTKVNLIKDSQQLVLELQFTKEDIATIPLVGRSQIGVFTEGKVLAVRKMIVQP